MYRVARNSYRPKKHNRITLDGIVVGSLNYMTERSPAGTSTYRVDRALHGLKGFFQCNGTEPSQMLDLLDLRAIRSEGFRVGVEQT